MQIIPPLTILKASAGSGKTFRLTVHYLVLLFTGDNKYREILAVTFTNKATAEMKDRILEVLEGLASGIGGCDADKTRGYRELILQAFPGWDEVMLQQKAADVYRRILHDYSRFSVSTIDGFVQKVIRGFTFELGIDASYKLEMNLGKVKGDLVRRLNILLDERPDLLQWIIDYARAKIDKDDHWNYRFALAELANEIFKEYFQDFDKAVSNIPGQELFSSLDQYTKGTIRQFEEEFVAILAAAADVVRLSGADTSAFAQKSRNPLTKLDTFKSEKPYLVHRKLLTYIDAPEEWQKGGTAGPMAKLFLLLNPLLKKLDSFYKGYAPGYYMAKAIDDNLYYLRLLKEMSNLLAGWRKENSAQLISDAQILLNNIGITESGDPTFIWEKTGQRYRHFLFDEFQDTSKKQWENFRPLLVNALGSAEGKRPEHLMVGDVKQSIYRWRNGDWRILLERAERELSAAFNSPGLKGLVANETLDVNYRSHENVVMFNNLLFRHAPRWIQSRINDRILGELGAENDDGWWFTSGLHDTMLRAYQDSEQAMPPAHHKQGGTVQVDFLPVNNNQHRASAVKGEALAKLYETLCAWIGSGQYRPGQIGILVRSNREAKEIVQYLLDKHPDFGVISADALLLANHPVVHLLINTLRALTAKPQEAGLYKAMIIYRYYHLKGMAPITADNWVTINDCQPGELAGLLPEELCQNWDAWQQLPLAELVELLIRAFGVQEHMASMPYLLAFRDLVAAFTANGERGIPAFLTFWAEEGEDKTLPPGRQSDAVEVMTIHKSKGLAFDVVMLPFCSWMLDGRPNSHFWVNTTDTPYALLHAVPVKYNTDLGKSLLHRAYFEEMLYNYMDALNTLYVATTRTRQHLYITAPGVKEGAGEAGSLLISDVLLGVLASHAADVDLVFNNGIRFNTLEQPSFAPSVNSGSSGWAFDHYPVSGHIQQVLIQQETLKDLNIVRQEKAKRQGRLLHELMTMVSDEQELPLAIDRLISNGWMQPEERRDVMAMAKQTLGQPQLQALLSSGFKQLNEKSIITASGKTLRPDKVLIGPDEVIVLDFKFTQGQDPAHVEQVNSYKQVLQQLGYSRIRAYIYYGYEGQLLAV